MTVSFDMKTIRLITLFENITGATVKDCILEDDIVYYVVEEGKIALAIGKNGKTIKSAERIIGKKIKVFEYDKSPVNFVKKLIPQSKEVRIREEGNNVIVEVKISKSDRPFVIGRDGKNIKAFKKILERTHKITDIKVK